MIIIENIHKTFNKGNLNEVYALQGISLSIEKGEFVTVIGTNGSGKSTLLNALAGTFLTEKGKIEINGEEVTGKPDFKRAKFISRVFQNPFMGTAANNTILENLHTSFLRGKRKYPLINLTKERVDFYVNCLKELEMQLEDRYNNTIGSLSGGQRQAITLLMAVITKPDIMLLDEHTAALDPKSASQVMSLTEKFVSKDKITTFMITHSMQQAIDYGDRLLMMHKGKIIEDIKGVEKKWLTVQDLLDKFAEIKKIEKLDDALYSELVNSYY